MSELMNNDEGREVKPSFVVDNDAKADWCLRKIREKQDELKRWKEHYEMLYATLEQQTNEELEYFTFQLENYLRGQQEAGFTKATKTQISYPLPSGKIMLKHQEPDYDRNNEKLVEWLEKNDPKLVKVKKEADWAGLKKKLVLFEGNMCTEDGEIVPGITVTVRPDKFAWEAK